MEQQIETMTETEAQALADAGAAEELAKGERQQRAHDLLQAKRAREQGQSQLARTRAEIKLEQRGLKLLDDVEAAFTKFVETAGVPREEALNVLRRTSAGGSFHHGFPGYDLANVPAALGGWREAIQRRIARLQERADALARQD